MANPSRLLPLFKGQLEAESASLAKKYGLQNRGTFLIYWYFMRLHDFTDTEVAEVMCDGGGDLAIDAIWIDDDDMVHFYQFKNPESPQKGTPAGEIDKMISGLQLVLSRQHNEIANPELRGRIEEIYQRVPKGYRIHAVSSGAGLEHESRHKLDALVLDLQSPSGSIIEWDEESLGGLQERFYQQNLPAVQEPLRFDVPATPYMLQSGMAECFLFAVDGTKLAELYENYKEGLLQRNIRVDQRDTATNRSIEGTSVGKDSANFLHFNNGVTFICDSAQFDPFKRVLTLNRAQVVNGGQTIRALHRAYSRGSLKTDVIVAARAIASSGDKDFANNVAVNQNNQNQVGAGFLRSNDQIVIQLDHALAALGWYLERREGELKNATSEERAAYQHRIGHNLEGRTIRLKDAAQAYTATYFGQPEIAKKNPRRIFLSVDDGGYYEKIFSSDMTADKIIIAHSLKGIIEGFVRDFAAIRRKIQASDDMPQIYTPILGAALAANHSEVIHQVMPQCSLFLCGTIFRDLTVNQKKDPSEIPEFLKKAGIPLIQEHIRYVIDFAKENHDKADRSWPVLLKSNTFFNHVTAYIAGIRKSG